MHRSAPCVEEQEGLRAEDLRLGGAADVRVAEVVPLVGALVGVEVGVAHVGRVVPAWSGSGLGSGLGSGSGLVLGFWRTVEGASVLDHGVEPIARRLEGRHGVQVGEATRGLGAAAEGV